ncbi:RHS repeat domain-containing protein [Pseudoflavitalea rhizosphaerae]|uniref:RHS repeat domain-containing protein n=1 Tax=Pseudoflavitalea rhizosphaerae TaxID=1884793 RepID=UPI000F8D5A38|nr:RHS repeat-associated core domain-containing protein [Pseudoflavitalea rhizosphaerae]
MIWNKVIKQVSPDGGTSEFWYDKLSRIVASQNSEQKVPTDPADPVNRYSFTKYDALGRIGEVGEKTAGIDITTINLSNQTELSNWYAQGTDRSLTQTVYDAVPVEAPAGAILENLRHRVSASIFRETRAEQKINATYFSYDISGNAKTVYQEIGELKALDNTTGIKKLEYDFDLVSGKVNMLTYQKDKGDQFFYKYEYDADNRIKEALTSRDGGTWNLEARYSYYLHGSLARVELGKNEVQGIDYAYTLSGWLKAINGKDLIPGEDMGGDGTTVSAAKNFSRDELAFTLGYFNGDYVPIGGEDANAISRKFEPEVFPAQTPYAGTGAPLYNGNISNSTVHMAPEILGAAKGYTYRYDQLNRLLTMRQHTGLPTEHGSIWNKTSETDDYKEAITYDANGNILSFLRNSYGATQMDDLAYHYNKDAKGNLLNNKLRHVGDEVLASAFDVDIDDQPVDNYAYDKIGNLISDVFEGLQKVKWTPYGKINSIQKANNVIQYEYDATGNRVWKSSNNAEKRSYYVRDPQGNVLAIYKYNAPSGSGGQGGTLSWAEQHLYGSQRLGLLTPEITVINDWQYPQNGPNSFVEGERTYELTNHLGNVLATINDRKIAVDQDNNGINDYFRAELLSVTDYYAFGMQMPGRKWSLGNYRYGFNGKENDNEVKGEGNSVSFKYRVHDPRLGRFLSVDPIASQYPYNSPYAFAENKVVQFLELEGLELTLPRYLGPTFRWPTLTLPKAPSIPIPAPPVIPKVPTAPNGSLNPSYPSLPVEPLKFESAIDWSNPPSSPDELGDGWNDVTDPRNKSGSKEYQNQETGEKIRWDPGKQGENGWEGKNHWHRYNPNSTGKKDLYLDKSGNPVARGSHPSHIAASVNFIMRIPGLIETANEKIFDLNRERDKLSIWRISDWKKIKEIGERVNKLENYKKDLENYQRKIEEHKQKTKEYNESCNCSA